MLADLAGSESAKRSTAQYQRLEEFKSINLSLSALGNCVAALAQVGHFEVTTIVYSSFR